MGGSGDNDLDKKNKIIKNIYISILYMKTVKKRPHKWSLKYKRSINCRRPRGFSQKQYCKYGRKK